MAAVPERDYDLIIVGASFAGAACALAAAQYGLRVCVLERKRDPGLKLHTTGIIVREAAEHTWLSRVPAALVRKVEHVRLYAPNLRNIALKVPDYYFLTTDTPNLMRWLADEMRDAGVDLRLAHSFTDASRSVQPHRGHWHLPGIGHAHWLIGADGAKSRVAQRFGLGTVRDFLYGVEYEFADLELNEPDALHCFIDKQLAPGYIGWATQNPTGVQFGLAFRHDTARPGMPDVAALRARVGAALGIPSTLQPTAIRAGLIPCGGPVPQIAKPGVILTGDAAGIVSPVTAGGIHSAWQHGWRIGQAVARHLRDGAPSPEGIAHEAAPRYRLKRALRWAFDHCQMDWPFNALIGSAPMRWAAERVYFGARGHTGAPAADTRETLR